MITIRSMFQSEREEVASLIVSSTNAWYQKNRGFDVFGSLADGLRVCDTYETLDPNCTLVAYDEQQKRIAGSCFYHPRKTHVSLGILNVLPDYFGYGIAPKLVGFILNLAQQAGKPVRLVSSAMNLDSFSVYSRNGFVPFEFFQDMYVRVPESGLEPQIPDGYAVRSATLTDVSAMVAMERSVQGIDREQDFRFFLENKQKFWLIDVLERTADKSIVGFMVAIDLPGCSLLGPGCMVDQTATIALISYCLSRCPGKERIVLVPSWAQEVTQYMYSLGAKNTETHVAQCCGTCFPVQGIVTPCFLPESN